MCFYDCTVMEDKHAGVNIDFDTKFMKISISLVENGSNYHLLFKISPIRWGANADVELTF